MRKRDFIKKYQENIDAVIRRNCGNVKADYEIRELWIHNDAELLALALANKVKIKSKSRG